MKNIKSIYFKNFFTIALVLLISFFVLGAAFSALSYSITISEQTYSMRQNAETASKIVTAYGREWGMDGLEVRASLSWLSETTGFHIIVCDKTGTVVSCSDSELNCPHIGKTVPAEIVSKLSRYREFYGLSTMGGLYPEERYAVGRMMMSPQGKFLGYILLSGALGEMSGMWRQFSAVFISTAVSVMALASIISYFTTKKQAQPIKEMAQAAHRFGRGDFSVRVTEDGRKDEIGRLAESFNIMADSLERSENVRRELIANVSHELKTPMTTITGFADGILDGTIPPEKEREYLSVISSETKRLSRLVRGMLDTSQIQSTDKNELRKKSFDIYEVICEVLLGMEQKINDRGLDVEPHLSEEAVSVRGDRDAVTQVVYNLIDNAVKFASQGSTLELSLWKQGGKAYVSVKNSGETIPKEELPQIFDRFHKTDRSRSADRDGVGLGLYIVKTILDNHGEDIFVTSGDGTTEFIFTLTLL